jgi:CheY-like chemotaxis protein
MRKAPQVVREYMPYGRVLVVDDVETNLYVAKGLLAPYGLSIETAISGFETIKKIEDGAVYDIVFMDHFMPKMDGIETVLLLRSMGYTRPIIALTANALMGQAEMFAENGFDGFISKPIDIRQLNASLNTFVRDRHPADEVEAARRIKDSNSAPETASLDRAFLNEKLQAIQAACAAKDQKTAKAALVALNKKSWPRTVKDQLNFITEQLMNGGFEAVAEAARSLESPQ